MKYDRHFYVDFYTYDRFDEALEDPINPIALYNINQMVVYKLNLGTQRNDNFIQGVAIADLGVTQNQLTKRYAPPNMGTDAIDDEYLAELRFSNIGYHRRGKCCESFRG